MTVALHHAFLDEFGGVAAFVPQEPFLVVAILVVPTPRGLELPIKRAFKRFGGSTAAGEMKAAHSSEETVRWILESIVKEDVSIIIVALDKRGIVKPPKDPEDLYRRTVTRSLRKCVERWPHLQVTLDKRYTHRYLRQKLERYIREGIADVPGQAVVIRQEDSRAVKALQAADYRLGGRAEVRTWRRQLLSGFSIKGRGRGDDHCQIEKRNCLSFDFTLPGAHLSRPSPLTPYSVAYPVLRTVRVTRSYSSATLS